MKRPVWLIWFLSILFVAGYVTRLWHPGTIISRLNLLDIGVAVAVIWQLARGGQFKLNRWLMVFLAFAALSLLAGSWQFGWTSESLLYLVRIVTYGLFFGVVSGWDALTRWSWLAWLGVATAVAGVIQYKVWPTIPMSLSLTNGFDPHSGRLFALWFDPNITAAFLVITAIATLALIVRGERRGWWTAALALQLLAIILTQSRSGLITLAVMVVVFSLVAWRRLLLLLVAGGLALIILSPTLLARFSGAVAVDDTVTARFVSWQDGWQVVKLAPITGVGYNNYQAAAVAVGTYRPQLGQVNLAANGSDSSLLTIWATTGLFGLVAWLLFVVSASWPPAATYWETAGRRAVLVGMFVNSFFINSWLLGPIWFLLALAWAPALTKKSTTQFGRRNQDNQIR